MIDNMDTSYQSCIVSIRDKTTNETIPLNTCTIQKICSMYSNTKLPIYKLVINNKPISRNNNYLVLYKCSSCDSQSEITLNLFMRKINKNIKRCDYCKNKDENKCAAQSEFMKTNIHTIRDGNYVKEVVKVKNTSLDTHLQKSELDWSLEDDEFKEYYDFNHLTYEDFERIRPKIISIGNDKIMTLDIWTYYPYYRVYNQSKFTPMLVNKTENRVEKPNYIKFKCENCDCSFTHRDLEIVKNQLKLFCQTCTLTNKTFKIRKLILKNGESIFWQSIPERRFIEWCEENNIAVKNGPKLQYEFKSKLHTYRVDFELPDVKMLIEIKDNHCWHQDQVKSGKFGAKENTAKEWCKTNNYKFFVVFPRTMQDMKECILKSCKI